MNFKYHFCPNKKHNIQFELNKKSSILFQRWQNIKPIISDEIDERFFSAFPSYEEKISTHGKQCEDFFNATTPNELLKSLNDLEIFILLSGFYLHDIGNVSFTKPYVAQEKSLHYEMGEKFINTQEWLPFSTLERQAIGKLCKWHNLQNWINKGSFKEFDIIIDNVIVRVHLLVELIQLSDFYHHTVDLTWTNL